MMQIGLVFRDLCAPLFGEHILLVPMMNFARHCSPICHNLVLNVPIMAQNDANVCWQRQNVAAYYKQLALNAQLHIASLLGGHCLTVSHCDVDTCQQGERLQVCYIAERLVDKAVCGSHYPAEHLYHDQKLSHERSWHGQCPCCPARWVAEVDHKRWLLAKG